MRIVSDTNLPLERSKPRIEMLGEGVSELKPLESDHLPKARFIGIGGAGVNIISDLFEFDTVAVSTTASHLEESRAHKKIELTRKEVEQLCTTDLSVADIVGGEGAKTFREIFRGQDLVIIIGGLGGTTFGPLAPIISRMARKSGCTVLVIGIAPFKVEGESRQIRARYQMEKLRRVPSGFILLENDSLIKVSPQLPLSKAFDVMNNIVFTLLDDLISSLTKSDVKKLRSFLNMPDSFHLTGGTAVEKHFPERLVKEALESPWLPDELEEYSVCIAFIKGGKVAPKDAIYLAKEAGEYIGSFNYLYSIMEKKEEKMKGRFKATLLLGK